MGIREFERRLTVALEAVLAAGMLGVFSTIVVLVTMRYVFQSGLVGANELATVAFIYLSSVGVAVAVGRDEHIRVDLLSGWLDARGKKALAVASLSLVALLNLVVVAYSVTWVATTGHTPMPASQLPRFVAQASVPMGCGLAVGACTPPGGTCLNVGAAVANLDIGRIFRGAAPFLAANAATLVLATVFPEIALWLPEKLMP